MPHNKKMNSSPAEKVMSKELEILKQELFGIKPSDQKSLKKLAEKHNISQDRLMTLRKQLDRDKMMGKNVKRR